ncbi:solute carrier family 2, facilitated glucose transporter member 10-like [Acanthaster planci]|uniref:Solute carrier family 2, facilitated glucose transporter member 10-like n=1 Tax=Acanthaster planci TaxID=133434 RepID=A0A8B7YUR7_ACAPL|nr:solute carrier family 2, facilitated glucose transporter member 10-like [Acanthaster planci]XP_022097039.1 solute carrier family 2, facilitated glucose transporter member 10-like [Acanthaster planci]XP_022097040.1 solute carrier family 2, facilitated glucose transporter member 10-like [Acanthaster planci]
MAELQGEIEEAVREEMVSLTPAEHQPAGTTKFVVLAATMAALGGILFGYDIGIVSGALLQLKTDFELSCKQQEMVVSLLLVGALIGALSGGFLVDWIGRRWAIILNTIIFMTGAVILAFAPVYEVLIIGRLIVGFAVSLSAIAECVYISEISPVKKRGRLVCVNEVGITLGILVAYLVNYFLISVPSGWRYMFGLSVVPALVQGVGMLFLPPSPRFLMKKGRETQARMVLQKLRGTELVEGELSNIRNSLLTEHEYRVCDVLSTVDNMRGRFLIGVGLVFFQQFTGQTNVLYYAPTIFQSLGFGNDAAATMATVGLGLVKVVSTTICLCCVDKAGRRHFLLVGAGIMTVIIIILGIVAQFSLPDQAKRSCIIPNTADDQPVVHQMTIPQTQGSLSFGQNTSPSLLSDWLSADGPSRVQREVLQSETHLATGSQSVEAPFAGKHTSINGIYKAGHEVNRRERWTKYFDEESRDISTVHPLTSLPEYLKAVDSVEGSTNATHHVLSKSFTKGPEYSNFKQQSPTTRKVQELKQDELQAVSKHTAQEFEQGATYQLKLAKLGVREAQSVTPAFSSTKSQSHAAAYFRKEGVEIDQPRARAERDVNPVSSAVTERPTTFISATGSIPEVTPSLSTTPADEQYPIKDTVPRTDNLAKTPTQSQVIDEKEGGHLQNLTGSTPPSGGDPSDMDPGIYTTATRVHGTDTSTGPSETTPPKAELSIAHIVAFVSLTLYVGAYSYGFGPVTWLVLSEIFPVGIRGRASSLATVFNWGTNVLVSLTFLDVMNGIGPSWTFLLYGLICSLAFIFIYCSVPETKNRSLEQISAALKKKSNLTGLPGHCCLRRVGFCCSCCHGNKHHLLPLTDSHSDTQGADDPIGFVDTDNTQI